jgi:hypothetical protein
MDPLPPRIAGEVLEDARRLQSRARRARRSSWFPVLLFGIATLGSLPLYVHQLGCADGATACEQAPGARGFGAFASDYPLAHGQESVSLYWVAAMTAVYLLTVFYYRRRYRHGGSRAGVRDWVWPIVAPGAVFLAVVLAVAEWLTNWTVFANDLGTEALAIIGVSLIVLALIDRTRNMALFAGGYVLLAAISLYYNVVNAFERIGIGGAFQGADSLLPNLLVPGIYLLMGGLVARWTAHKGSVDEQAAEP